MHVRMYVYTYVLGVCVCACVFVLILGCGCLCPSSTCLYLFGLCLSVCAGFSKNKESHGLLFLFAA